MSAKGSELKRVRQSRKANEYNNHYKTMMKTLIKKVLGSTTKKEADAGWRCCGSLGPPETC